MEIGIRDNRVMGRLDCSEEHLRAFYEIDHSALYKALVKAGVGREGAESYVGGFWLHCRDRWHQYDPQRGTWFTWMCRQARHYMSVQRKQERQYVLCGGLPNATTDAPPVSALCWGPRWEVLARTLTELERDVVEWAVLDGKVQHDLDRAKGWALGTTHMLLKRALGKLRRALEGRQDRQGEGHQP